MFISIWLSGSLLVLLVPQCSSIKYLYLSKLAELDRAEHNSWLIFYKWSLIEDLRGLKLNIFQFFWCGRKEIQNNAHLQISAGGSHQVGILLPPPPPIPTSLQSSSYNFPNLGSQPTSPPEDKKKENRKWIESWTNAWRMNQVVMRKTLSWVP